MKCYTKIAASVLLVLATVLTLSISAFATKSESTVTYDGTSQKFIFAPGSDKSPTDLFSDFKSVMPGDKLTQRITVNNKISEQVKINLYLKSTLI